MASRPQLRALEAEIERRGGSDYMFDRVRDGETIESIMREFGLSRAMFYRWVHAGGDEREAEFDRAREDKAHTLAEQVLEIIDDKDLETAPTPAEVNRARMRVSGRQWLASKMNRAAYGDDALVNIQNQMTLGDLHLDALVQHGLKQGNGEIEEAEFEVLEPAPVDAVIEFDDLPDTELKG